MGRKTTTVKRRVGDEDGDEEVIEAGKTEQDLEKNIEDRETLPDLVGASGAEMEEEESDPEIEELDEGFEEMEDVVNAVMELDPNEEEDPIEDDGISGDVESEANLCEDGVIELKEMNPNQELPAEEKDSDANCLNSPSGKDQDDAAEGDLIDDSDLITRTEENLDEGVPSASELSKTDDDNDGEEEEEESKEDNDGEEEEIKEDNDGEEEESKEGRDEPEHNVGVNSDVIEDNGDGEKESKEDRDDLEQSGKDGNVEENKASSSNVSLGNARSVEISATPMHRPRERVLLQVKTVCLQRLPKSWDVEKIKETCKQYGVIKRAELFRNFSKKGNDVGFVAFTTRESAVACVEGINNAQFGECKVKADIMRPFVGGRLRKDARKGFKVKEMCRRALIDVTEKQAELKEKIGINKSMENAEGNPQVRTSKRNRGRGGRNKSQSGVIEARGDGMPSNSERKGRRRRWRKGKRGGQQDDNQRPPNKQSGNLQVHPRDSLRSTRRKPHFKRKPAHNAGRMPYAEKHAASASSSRRPGYARNGISRSKRPATYMQPHGGYLEHHRNHRRHIEPPRRHQQIHPSYVNPPVRYEVAPRATYLQPVQTKDSLPHAGLMQFSARAYNGTPEQGSTYRGVNHFPPTYAPNYTNYAGYEGSSNGSGYRPSSEAYYHPRRPRY